MIPQLPLAQERFLATRMQTLKWLIFEMDFNMIEKFRWLLKGLPTIFRITTVLVS